MPVATNIFTKFVFFLHLTFCNGLESTIKKGGGRCQNLKNGKEASEVTEANPAGFAGEG